MRTITTTEAIMANSNTGQELVDILYTLGVNPEYLDDHKPTPTVVKPGHVLLLTNGLTTKVCPIGPKINGVWAFSINPLYVENGRVHLSKVSMGTFHVWKDCPIGEAIDIFNQAAEATPNYGWYITALVGL